MTEQKYTEPVSLLLTNGDVRGKGEWMDYLALGFTDRHIPQLIQMMIDEDLSQADSDNPEVWAPLHAWRTLAQLRAEEAIEPLISILHRIDEDDDEWLQEESPIVFGMIGIAALPALKTFLSDKDNGESARSAAAGGIEKIAKNFPASRAYCVAALTEQLSRFREEDPELNALIISYMIDMKAVEALPLIKQAFDEDRVEEWVNGDLEEVEIELGVREERETPAENWLGERFGLAELVDALLASDREPGGDWNTPYPVIKTGKEKSKTRNKRKQAKAARKKNRQRRR